MDLRLFIIEISLLIVTCLSVIVAGVSAYLSYKARTSPFREALYSKQIEGYVKLANAINDFSVKAIGFINEGGLKTKGGPERRSQALDKLVNVGLEHLKWTVVLEREMGSSVINFIDECKRILDLPFNKENKDLLGDELKEILNKIRDIIGTEPLSRETIELIGKIKG